MTIRYPRISIDPNVMSGQPVVAGTRVPVSILLHLIAQRVPEAEILENYPSITRGDIPAAIQVSAEMMERFIYGHAA